MIIAFAGVIRLGTLVGILIAVLIPTHDLMYQVNRPPVYAIGHKPNTDIFRPLSDIHPEDETFPGLLLVRTEGRLYFANVFRVQENYGN